MRKKPRKRKTTKKTRIERLNERTAQLSKEITSVNQRIEATVRRDNDIRAEYANAKRRWGSVARLAAKYDLHRSAVHRIIKRKNVDAPVSLAMPKPSLEGMDRAISSPLEGRTPKSQSKPERSLEHNTAPREGAAQGCAPPSNPKGNGPSVVATDWIRALNDIRDFAAKSSEPRIAQLLDSVMRGMKEKKGGSR
jgi:hypothetical protein